MSGVDWRLGIMPDIGGNAMAAFKQGREERDKRQQQDAMAAYATNPNAPNALDALARFDPKFVVQQKQAQQQQAESAMEKQLLGDALANPDPAAKAAARQRLAYVNHAEYQKLGEEQKKAVDTTMKAVAQQAFQILQLPEDQQPQALQQALQGLQAQGMDVSKIDLSQGPKQTLMSALAMTGALDQWETFAQPKYAPVGERGMMGSQFGKPIMQGGQVQDFGPAAPAGVTFAPLDDDPAGGGAPRSWEPGGQYPGRGGAGGNASGPFRP